MPAWRPGKETRFVSFSMVSLHDWHLDLPSGHQHSHGKGKVMSREFTAAVSYLEVVAVDSAISMAARCCASSPPAAGSAMLSARACNREKDRNRCCGKFACGVARAAGAEIITAHTNVSNAERCAHRTPQRLTQSRYQNDARPQAPSPVGSFVLDRVPFITTHSETHKTAVK
jgi:hypothetical protein